jgi:RNA polymerase subunit RPABC4/transcription elongation factor Spt4
MTKKKVCKKCSIFVEGNECPICKGENFVTAFKGKAYILNAEKSIIAKRIGAPVNGEYALKTN